jgi:phage/plasmid-like protein (TIGR03299 family)
VPSFSWPLKIKGYEGRGVAPTQSTIAFMAHEFSSGIFSRNTAAWHGLGKVVESMGVDEAFQEADALFRVRKAPLSYHSPLAKKDLVVPNRYAVLREDDDSYLGTVAEGYELVQNDRLLEMAHAACKQSGVEMDAVIVLADGKKVSFTALLPEAETEIIKGDLVARYLVGWLGHDGLTGVGGMYTDVRVVCRNTLDLALGTSGEGSSRRTIMHSQGANNAVSRLIQTLDIAKRTFTEDMEQFQLMARTKLPDDGLVTMMEAVFAKELAKPFFDKDLGISRERMLHEVRAVKHVFQAAKYGMGTDIPGVAGTVWGAYNALTEVLASTADAANSIKTFERTMFGNAGQRVLIAKEAALALCS